jgi:hypothetical protein
MNEQPNRREAIKTFGRATAIGAAQAAIVGLAVHATQAHAATSLDRDAWDASMRTYKAACEASATWHSNVYDPIRAAYDAAVSAVPHVTFPPRHGRALSTADEWEVKGARSSLKTTRYVEQCALEDHQTQVALVEAADARNTKIAQIRKDTGLDVANVESERLSEVSYGAFRAVAYTPVGSAALLQEKWAFLVKEEALEGWEDAITADIARLVAREA